MGACARTSRHLTPSPGTPGEASGLGNCPRAGGGDGPLRRRIGGFIWRRTIVLFSLLLAAVLVPSRASAAAPSIEYLFPAGGHQGTTVTITVRGKPDAKDAKIDPWPAKVWADSPGLEFKPA